jgi:hypothetical protein
VDLAVVLNLRKKEWEKKSNRGIFGGFKTADNFRRQI